MEDVLTPSKPSLWRKPTFDVVDFADHFFSFSGIFTRDYQRLSAQSPSQLSTFIETKLMRCFLVEKVLREKCYDALGRM